MIFYISHVLKRIAYSDKHSKSRYNICFLPPTLAFNVGLIAQLVEQDTHNVKVAGSSPAWSTNITLRRSTKCVKSYTAGNANIAYLKSPPSRSHRLMVRTTDFHSVNRSSILLKSTIMRGYNN